MWWHDPTVLVALITGAFGLFTLAADRLLTRGRPPHVVSPPPPPPDVVPVRDAELLGKLDCIIDLQREQLAYQKAMLEQSRETKHGVAHLQPSLEMIARLLAPQRFRQD